jgi:hypothetical protein
MLRTKLLKLGKTGLQGFQVKLAPECEIVELELQLEQFELEEGIDAHEKVVALGSNGMGRRTRQAGVDLTDLWKTSIYQP